MWSQLSFWLLRLLALPVLLVMLLTLSVLYLGVYAGQWSAFTIARLVSARKTDPLESKVESLKSSVDPLLSIESVSEAKVIYQLDLDVCYPTARCYADDSSTPLIMR